MKNKQKGESAFEVVATIVVFVIWGFLMLIFSNMQCKSRWEDSGMKCSWGPIQGCLVHLPDGRKIPDDRIREIDVPKTQQERM